jgi:hypothetical protein
VGEYSGLDTAEGGAMMDSILCHVSVVSAYKEVQGGRVIALYQ